MQEKANRPQLAGRIRAPSTAAAPTAGLLLLLLEHLIEDLFDVAGLEPARQADDADAKHSSPAFRTAIELIRSEIEPRSWQAFWRTAIDGQKASEVAIELGMSHAAVRKAKSRVLSRLRGELSNPLDESD